MLHKEEVTGMRLHGRLGAKRSEWIMGYGFSLPAVLFLAFFVLFSIFYCFHMSFYEWKLFDLGAEKTFVGLDNYIYMFKDKVFRTVVGNSLLIVVCCLAVETLLGFAIALTLWAFNRTTRWMQTVFLLPMITSPVVVGLIWRYIYDPQFGILNYVLGKTLGIGDTAWLGDARYALFSVMVVDIWQMTPFTILILYAALLGISEEWIEAAQLDGAGFFTIVRRIVIPAVLPMTSFILLMRTMDLMKIFDTIYILTRGGPGYATETLAMYTYRVGFSEYNMGYAMALSIVILLIVLAISSIYIRRNNQRLNG